LHTYLFQVIELVKHWTWISFFCRWLTLILQGSYWKKLW